MSKTHPHPHALPAIGLTIGILLLAWSSGAVNRMPPSPNPGPTAPEVPAALDTGQEPVPPIPRAPAATSSSNAPAYFIEGPLALDPPTDRVFARGRIGDRPATLVLAAESGELLTSVEPVGEIAVDPERRRLYIDVLDRGLFSLDLDSLTRKAVVALPRPVPDQRESMFGKPSIGPIVELRSGQVLAFRDRNVHVIDPEQVRLLRTFAPFPLPSTGYLRDAVLDQDRGWLYLTAHDGSIPAYMIGSRLIGYDLERDTVVLEHGVMGSYVAMLAWDGQLWTLDVMGRRPGVDSRRWRDGKLVERVLSWNSVGDPTGWLALDRKGQKRMLHVEDRVFASDLQGDSPPFVASISPGTASDPTLPTMNDRRLKVGDDGRLIALAALDLSPPRPRLSSPASAPDYGAAELFPISEDRIYALSRVDFSYAPSPLVESRDMGRTWSHPGAGLPRTDQISDLAVSPDFASDRTMLASTRGSGIFRSVNGGRLWKPVAQGPDTQWIEKLWVSPAFAADQTAFATGMSFSFYDPGQADGWGTLPDSAWRSTDGGVTWQGMGRLTGLALSPDFANDRRLLAFQTFSGEVLESRDAGQTWHPVGKLPFPDESGLMGVNLWALNDPDSGPEILLAFAADSLGTIHLGSTAGLGRLYRSVNGGRHWTLVLDDPVQTIYSVESFLGPIGRDKRDLVIRLHQESPVRFDSSDAVYRSSDLGASWRLIGRAAQVQIAALSDGDLVFSNAESSIQRIRLDDLPAMLSQHLWRNQRFLPSIVQGH